MGDAKARQGGKADRCANRNENENGTCNSESESLVFVVFNFMLLYEFFVSSN